MDLLFQFGIIAATRDGAPVNTVPPVLDDTSPLIGDEIHCDTGLWTPIPDSYVYQWLRDGFPIVGATGSAYEVTEDDIGAVLSCEVTASNAVGDSDPEESNGTASIPSNVTTFSYKGTAYSNNDTIPEAWGHNYVLSTDFAAGAGGIVSAFAGEMAPHPGLNSATTFTITAQDGVTTLDITVYFYVGTSQSVFEVDFTSIPGGSFDQHAAVHWQYLWLGLIDGGYPANFCDPYLNSLFYIRCTDGTGIDPNPGATPGYDVWYVDVLGADTDEEVAQKFIDAFNAQIPGALPGVSATRSGALVTIIDPFPGPSPGADSGTTVVPVPVALVASGS